ncbi:Mu-like prophage major head subunit gpT family protein [Xenorhabdus bovienii]|uniref:Putative major head subunit protein n=1 Tax=Xenorhabdus bovienii str. oregonense TaxID=1398202 RepID=A0A077PC52_XENBV|nr:Mu-like prophage major head subunit gpT family protein [Xenorhabdus bovienii]MDE9466881.1 Mu-like prophage major head subunit gpT family protein [Xenorhabdus bovienii]CDH07231.1 putative major head subunit protein [Xenorhabdus bovienii str. oregonense]
MIVNKSNLSVLFVAIKATFQNAMETAPTQWEKVAMKVPSTGKSNLYTWLSNFPAMRKWIGEKAVKSLEGHKYTLVNDDWETTIEVDRNDIEDDETGQYAIQAKGAGNSAAQLPDDIVFELVNLGFERPCYDGQYFFDDDHPVGQRSVSNKGRKKLSIDSLAKAKAAYGAARTAMRNMKDDEGRPLRINPDILLVPPALEDTANALMTVDRLEDGKANIYKGTATVIVEPRLTSDSHWFLLDTSHPVKPFIYQERKAPVLVEQTSLDSDEVFTKKKLKFGAEARAAGGYGFWQTAYGSTGEEE